MSNIQKQEERRSDYQRAKDREMYRNIKNGNIILKERERWIFEAGKLAAIQETKKSEK